MNAPEHAITVSLTFTQWALVLGAAFTALCTLCGGLVGIMKYFHDRELGAKDETIRQLREQVKGPSDMLAEIRVYKELLEGKALAAKAELAEAIRKKDSEHEKVLKAQMNVEKQLIEKLDAMDVELRDTRATEAARAAQLDIMRKELLGRELRSAVLGLADLAKNLPKRPNAPVPPPAARQ